jgi:hypothetical protein
LVQSFESIERLVYKPQDPDPHPGITILVALLRRAQAAA